jgi:opacity protein-like surface antigen
MSRFSLVLATTGLTFGLGQQVIAADMVLKAPPAPAISWAGWYAGINAGGGMAAANFWDPDCSSCADPAFRKPFATIGGQVGYNWQIGSMVFGLEGDLNWVSARASQPFAIDDNNDFFGTARFRFDAFGSLRGRAGIAFDRTLIYVTAGPAWGHFKSSVDAINAPPDGQHVTDDSWHLGVAAGAGIEFLLTPDWTLRGEYLFLDFVDKNVPFNPSSRTIFTDSARLARLGLNYKLGAPTVANAAVATPAYGWAGLYAGINGGGGVAGADLLDPDCFSCANIVFHKAFGTFGGQLGYNWQFGSTVLGLEGDLNRASFNESGPFARDRTTIGTAQAKFDAFGTLRARAGLAIDRTLVYVTAGSAWGHFDSSIHSILPADVGGQQVVENGWHFGIAAGAGVEVQLAPSWTLRGESLYLNFVDKTVQFNPTARTTFAYAAQLARLGLNYKFGEPALAAPATSGGIFKAPATSWAGWYIGVNGGGGVARLDVLDPDCFSCTDISSRRPFGTVGGQGGYNWQHNVMVLGLEGDINRTSFDESQPFSLGSGGQGTVRVKFDAFGSLRARAGLAVDRTLIYVTAGPAWGHFNSSEVSTRPDQVHSFDNGWRAGIAAGTGLEFQLASNWNVRAEYLYLDFVDKTFQFDPNGRTTFGHSAQLARIGLSYRPGDWSTVKY